MRTFETGADESCSGETCEGAASWSLDWAARVVASNRADRPAVTICAEIVFTSASLGVAANFPGERSNLNRCGAGARLPQMLARKRDL